MIEDRRPPVLGQCHCCQLPVRAGEDQQVGIDHATSASPMVLLHRAFCRPRTTTRRTPR